MRLSSGKALMGFAILTGLAALVAESGCGPVSNYIEAQIKAKLPSAIGPADSYEVSLMDTPASSLLRGKIGRLHIEGTRVRPDAMPVIKRIVIDARDIKADIKRKSVDSIAETAFQIELDQDDLRDFLRHKYDDQADVTIKESGLTLSTLRSISGLKVRIAADGYLVPDNERQVSFKLTGLHVSKLPVPPKLAEKILAGYNPVFDASALPFTVRIKKLALQERTVVISGEAEGYLGKF
ncbi:MAG: DUF2993 domain-containing protein [bacterium]|nr:DUF2993 domain-containing protein [bacterium]